MLDKQKYGDLLPSEPLKCEKCGLLFVNEDGYEADYDSIDSTGLCCSCYDEEKEFERDVFRTLEDNL
jgi:hypothetical protein